MTTYESFDRLMTSLEAIRGSFVIKDFVGFLNWEPSLSTLLLPYTGHHYAFCQSVKQSPTLYACCAICSNAHQRRCCQGKVPFTGTCFLGISEYAVPLMIDDLCIGSLSMGNFCVDKNDAMRRLEKQASRLFLPEDALIHQFETSVISKPPSQESCASYQFAATFLCEEYRPYVQKIQSSHEKINTVPDGFEAIQNYIFNNYTSPTISTADIAEACHYSQSYVSHTFSRHMKTNIRTYINQLRIVLAKRELARGSSVSYTAMICGFNDANYFSNIFHDMVGVAPSQYAKHILPAS